MEAEPPIGRPSETPRCQGCGARLPAGTPDDLCPFCVPEEPALGARVLGDCELFEEIGRGGMGVVWRGRQRGLDREVAVKTLPGGDLAGAEARARFRAEAQAAARLKHPNIVPVHDVGEADGMPYFVMELVEGRTLSAVLAEEKVPARQAASWLREAALAVQHAHEHGVLHRDLKPSNILIEEGENGGRPRLTDFGLAKIMDAEGGLTMTGTAAGSPAFMSPEQARRGEFTVQSDVYGLGAVLYCALTGRPPFHGESVATILAAVEREEPLPPRRLNGSVPRDLETVCLKCLEKNPARRYPTALALAEDLARFLDDQPVLARPINWPTKLARSARRRPWHAAAVLLAAAMVAGVIFSLAWKARAEHQFSQALQREQNATKLALARAQLGEARAIVRLRQADSRARAVDMVREVVEEDPPAEIRQEAGDVAIAALALPAARSVSLLGQGVVGDDWTMAAGDLPRARWALADYHGHVVLRPIASAQDSSAFDTKPRVITALIAFSPRGRWLAIRHQEELGIWDTTPDAPKPLVLAARPWAAGRRFDFMKIAFAPDDRAVLWQDAEEIVATALPSGEEMARWRAADGSALRSECLAFDPAGKKFAVALANQPVVELRAWPSGEIEQVFSGLFARPLAALAMTAGADRLAGGDSAGNVSVWRGEAETSALLEFRGHTGSIRALAFAPEGRYLVSTSEDALARLWDCVSATEIASLPFDAANLTFSPDGGRLGVGYSAGRMAVAEIAHSSCFHRFRPDTQPSVGQALSFFRDGQSLACLGDGWVLRVSVPEGKPLARLAFSGPHAVLAEPNEPGRLFISGMAGVVCHDLSQPGMSATILPAARYGWDSITASADGRWLAASDNAGARLAVWPSGDHDGARARFLHSGDAGAGPLALSPDGAFAAVAFRYEPGLLLFDLATESVRQKFDLPGRHNLAWSPDGRWLAASGTTTPLWDTATWESRPLPALASNHPPAGAVAFSWPEKGGPSRLMAVATDNSRIALVGLPERRLLATLEPPLRQAIHEMEFSRDGRWLGAATARGEIHLWDLPALWRELAALGLASPHSRAANISR